MGLFAIIEGVVKLKGQGATGKVTSTTDGSKERLDASTGAEHDLNDALGRAIAIGGHLDDSATTAATEDAVAPVRITPQRGLHVNLRGVGGGEVGTASAPVRTDPTGTTTQPVSNAAATQADGHSATIGATTDADTALTVVGRLKRIVVLLAGGLPAALVGGRLDSNIGSWLGSTAPTVGQKTIAASVPVTIASDQPSVDVVQKDSAGNEVTALDGDTLLASQPGLVVMGGSSADVAKRLLVTDDGRLITSTAVAAPPGFTQVNQGVAGDVTTVTDTFYTIPNGQQLKIQRFSGGGEEATGGSKIELFWAPNGDNTATELIRVGYVNGNNFEFILDYDAPALGDGTRAILIKRTRFSGGAVELAGFWDGYY